MAVLGHVINHRCERLRMHIIIVFLDKRYTLIAAQVVECLLERQSKPLCKFRHKDCHPFQFIKRAICHITIFRAKLQKKSDICKYFALFLCARRDFLHFVYLLRSYRETDERTGAGGETQRLSEDGGWGCGGDNDIAEMHDIGALGKRDAC